MRQFTVDIELYLAKFNGLSAKNTLYAEYEISRTPGAQQ